MLDLIADGLRLEKDVESGKIALKSLKQYQRDVLINRDAAVRLLQARQNFLGSVIINDARATDPNLGNQINFAIAGLGLKSRPWTFDMDKLNLAKTAEDTRYLKWANESRDLLRSIGEEVYVDRGLQFLLDGVTEKTQKQVSLTMSVTREAFSQQWEAYKANLPSRVAVTQDLKCKSDGQNVPNSGQDM